MERPIEHQIPVNMVMLVRDRPRHTAQTLESLSENTPHLYNLTIMDDGSQEETRQYLLRYVRSTATRDGYGVPTLLDLRDEPCNNPGHQLNKGVRLSEERFGRGEYLYISANDMYFTDRWLEILITAFQSTYGHNSSLTPGGIKVLGGWCHPYHQTNKVLTQFIPNHLMKVGPEYCDPALMCPSVPYYEVHTKNALSGPSWLMRWEDWDKYGQFHENPGIQNSEDWEYSQRIRKDGYEVGAVWPWVVYHTGRTDTYGNPAVGAETFEDVEGVWIG